MQTVREKFENFYHSQDMNSIGYTLVRVRYCDETSNYINPVVQKMWLAYQDCQRVNDFEMSLKDAEIKMLKESLKVYENCIMENISFLSNQIETLNKG